MNWLNVASRGAARQDRPPARPAGRARQTRGTSASPWKSAVWAGHAAASTRTATPWFLQRWAASSPGAPTRIPRSGPPCPLSLIPWRLSHACPVAMPLVMSACRRAEQPGKRMDRFEQQRVDAGLLVCGAAARNSAMAWRCSAWAVSWRTALAGRRCECRRDERGDPARCDRDAVEADRQRDLEQFAPDWPLRGHRPRHDRDDQAERHGRVREAPPRRRKLPNQAGTASIVQTMSKTRERGGRVPGSSTGVQKDGCRSILAAFPRAQCFFLRRRGGVAARRPGRSARSRSRTGTRSRSTGSAHARWSAGRPTGPRRRWWAGRARTP